MCLHLVLYKIVGLTYITHIIFNICDDYALPRSYVRFFLSHSFALELGCDVFLSTYDGRYDHARVALLTHKAAIDGQGYTTLERFIEDNRFNIVKVFVPEHGYYTTTPATKSIDDDRYLRIPLVSLYGQHRAPTASMLSDVDVIICDLQDVGLRCYTYISTILKTVEAAAQHQVSIVILDRPNPIGMVCDGATLGGDISLKVLYIVYRCAVVSWYDDCRTHSFLYRDQ